MVYDNTGTELREGDIVILTGQVESVGQAGVTVRLLESDTLVTEQFDINRAAASKQLKDTRKIPMSRYGIPLRSEEFVARQMFAIFQTASKWLMRQAGMHVPDSGPKPVAMDASRTGPLGIE